MDMFVLFLMNSCWWYIDFMVG